MLKIWFLFFLAKSALVYGELHHTDYRCPGEWKKDGSTNKCYFVIRGKTLTNNEAEEACYDEGNAILAVIDTQETLQFADDIFQMERRKSKKKFPADRVWISSNSKKSMSSNVLSPSLLYSSSGCLAFLPKRGNQDKNITSMPCDLSMETVRPVENILCETVVAENDWITPCDKKWSLYEERNVCHRIFNVGISSADGAEAFCQSYSAKLSTILTIKESRFVSRLTADGWKDNDYLIPFPLNQAWVGLKKMIGIDTLAWNNGEFLQSRDKRFLFAPGEPNGRSGEQQCFTVDTSGQLSDISCDSWQYIENEENIVSHLICEKQAYDNHATDVSVSSLEKTESCSGDWSIAPDGLKCHKFFQIGVTTMDGAQRICQANGGRLSSLNTRAEVEFVTELMQRGWKISGNSSFYNHVWVSLRRSEEDRIWKWNNNKTLIDDLGKVLPNQLELSNCAAYQPINFIQGQENVFGEVPCDTSQHEFVYPPSHILCERDHDGPQPTKTSSLECPDKWHYHESDEMCIKLFVEDSSSYYEAQSRCIAEGGNLVSASTPEKQKFVFGLTKLGWRSRITELSKSVMWVGITKEENKFKWLNGDDVEDDLFIPSFSEHLNYSCVVMYPKQGTLTSLQGSAKGVECEQSPPVEHFMCEKDSVSKGARSTRLLARMSVGVTLILILGFVLWSIFRFCYRKKNQQSSNGEYKDPFSFEKLLSPTMPLDSAAPFLSFDQRFVISPKNVDLMEKIGEGCYGVVCRAVLRHPKKRSLIMDVAGKHVRDINDIDQRESLAIEITFLSKLGSHPNVIKFIGAITSSKSRHGNMLIMEYCSRGNLRDYVVSIKYNSDFNKENLSNFALQIACGMDYISAIPCIHRDLAARNVLLTENFICKINDFGLSKNEDYYKGISSRCLPFRWMAPESIERRRFTLKSDIWSFGIVLFEIFSFGSKPYPDISQTDFVSELLSERVNEIPDGTPKEIASLMEKCWQIRPQDRPTFAECFSTLKEYLSKSNPKMWTHYTDGAKKAAELLISIDKWMPIVSVKPSVQINSDVQQ